MTKQIVLFLVLFLFASTTSSSDKKWASFMKLTNYHQGQSPHGLASVKLYLNTLGYLPTKSKSTTFDDKFDATFETALLAYQEYYNLNKSGVLDIATVKLMAKPRCGNPDIIAKNTTANNGKLFSIHGNRWRCGSVLKYHLISHGTTTQQKQVGTIIGHAFSAWSRVANLSFRRVSTENQADITIGFYMRDHGDGYPFDGPKGTLAHAFFPWDGRVHFDMDELWALNPVGLKQSPRSVDLLSVATHEIGHALGLRHSSHKNAVMYAYIDFQESRYELTHDDILGIRYLYGAN